MFDCVSTYSSVVSRRDTLPSPICATGSRLAAAIKTFDALPFACMISTFQSGGLRKPSPVRRGDLWHTEPLSTVPVRRAEAGQPSRLSQAPPFRAGELTLNYQL
ncbi:hypothetical protein Atep_30160 (plasmid) [Allochromatium tepidum]|uniref:Uncharacterized protein n=1 Tax=Allochromatium tepidum TaxID=553982 RepID=A0ABM7QRX3_9GAMM|nr:hypothetical protein Atep_30160 [Allochromatium tepidum]